MNQNKCPSEETWDRYLSRRDGLEFQDLDMHLRQCAYCRFYLFRRKEELSSYAKSWLAHDRGEIIKLYPWAGLPTDEAIDSRMAAKGFSEESATESISLLSPDRNVMLKAVRDRSTDEIWLYLISDDPSLTRSILVKPFGLPGEYLTDDKGRINLGKIEWPSVENHLAEVRMPFASFNMIPMKDIVGNKDYVMLTTTEGDQVKVTLTDSASGKIIRIEIVNLVQMPPSPSLKLGVRHEKRSELMLVGSEYDRQMTLSNITGYEPIEIYLFK